MEILANIKTDSIRIGKVEFVDAKTVEMITIKGVGRLSLASGKLMWAGCL